MTIPSSIVPTALACDRSKRNVQFKPLTTLPTLTNVDYIQVGVPFRCKNAQEIRTLAKQVGVRYHAADVTWRISPIAIQQLGVVDTLNDLCLVCTFVQKKNTTEFLNRGMYWKTIICKVPFEDRGIVSAAGARWNSSTRFWWIAVKHNDVAFSDLIRDWEIAGWIDLDATEHNHYMTSRDYSLDDCAPVTYSLDQLKATRMIGATPIGGQFSDGSDVLAKTSFSQTPTTAPPLSIHCLSDGSTTDALILFHVFAEHCVLSFECSGSDSLTIPLSNGDHVKIHKDGKPTNIKFCRDLWNHLVSLGWKRNHLVSLGWKPQQASSLPSRAIDSDPLTGIPYGDLT